MAATPFNLASFTDATDLSIQKIFKKEADNPTKLREYYNFRTTEDLIEKDSSLTGLQESEFTDENGEIFEDVNIQGFDQSYTQEQNDILVSITYQNWKFGLKRRQLENTSAEINNALNRKKDKLAAERLTNGFSTSYNHQGVGKNTSISLTGGDSLEPWSAVHTRPDGGTNINNVITDGSVNSLPFDYAGYKSANRTASLWVDGRGNPMPGRLDTLVCKTGSSVFHKAMEINGALKGGNIPESNDNDAGALPPLKVIQLDYLTKDAAYGIFDSSRALTDKYGFQHIESEANNMDKTTVTKTRELQFVGHSLYKQGFNSVGIAWTWSEGDSATV